MDLKGIARCMSTNHRCQPQVHAHPRNTAPNKVFSSEHWLNKFFTFANLRGIANTTVDQPWDTLGQTTSRTWVCTVVGNLCFDTFLPERVPTNVNSPELHSHSPNCYHTWNQVFYATGLSTWMSMLWHIELTDGVHGKHQVEVVMMVELT